MLLAGAMACLLAGGVAAGVAGAPVRDGAAVERASSVPVNSTAEGLPSSTEAYGPTVIPADPVETEWLPENLVGSRVFDLGNNRLGTISAIAPDSGEGARLVVEYGGFLGLFTDEVEVPARLFFREPSGRVYLSLTEPEFYDLQVKAQQTAGRE